MGPPAKRGGRRWDLSFSGAWGMDGPDSEAIEDRVVAITAHYQNGVLLRGKDKASGPPFDAHGIRHSHVYERRADPLIFYRVFPAADDADARIHFIIVATHAEAFRGNENVFFAAIRDHLGESAVR